MRAIMTLKELYSTIKTMVYNFQLDTFQLEFISPNFDADRTSCDADFFITFYEMHIKGTAYENAHIYDIKRYEESNGIRMGINGKVLARLFNDLRFDCEWWAEHFYDEYEDDEPFNVNPEVYPL